jgi:hypothetical protein
MDLSVSDVAVRHALTCTTLTIQHSLDISPSTLLLAKELRYCVITVVLGFTAVTIFRSVLEHRRPPRGSTS